LPFTSLIWNPLELAFQLPPVQNLKDQLLQASIPNSGVKASTVILTGCVIEYETLFCNPWLSGRACYSITFRLSFLLLAQDSGTKCLSGAVTDFPKETASVSENLGPKPFI
jgi:hypothetical protein